MAKRAIMRAITFDVPRTRKEVNALRQIVDRYVSEGSTRYRADTFEGGVQATLQWLFGETDAHPSLEPD